MAARAVTWMPEMRLSVIFIMIAKAVTNSKFWIRSVKKRIRVTWMYVP